MFTKASCPKGKNKQQSKIGLESTNLRVVQLSLRFPRSRGPNEGERRASTRGLFHH
jgi:hypothetical protein